MKEYTIELYTTIQVRAESEDEAINKAFEIVGNSNFSYEIYNEEDCN